MSADGKKMLVGGAYKALLNKQTSPVALLEISSSLQTTAMLDLPCKTENPGCTIIRRISKKNFYLACTSEGLYLLSIESTNTTAELVINLKVPHCHQGISPLQKV